ncbi:hypothetical protein KP78_05590 [Jeotgalibacillus soli]|uniref:Uncharacterized protein n=1 Tax=Jeotgalibacillus soli TaxID=889306 RepID=A0A0C2SE06_9BACL|nr:hypothetical protein KP78_05590 [Jeotgalibacillus soli]
MFGCRINGILVPSFTLLIKKNQYKKIILPLLNNLLNY